MSDFRVGDVVEHRINHEYLFILAKNDDGTYTCRTKQFDTIIFNEIELTEKRS